MLPPHAFTKEDVGDDLAFYAPPRLVTHIDDAAMVALTAYYAEVLPADGIILDLMSSWISHLPPALVTREVIGHGMNADELAANPRLTRWFVQNLNRDASLPIADHSLDAALCCVGIQYLQRPIEVLGEVRRALRPGGSFVISFSNRCFPTKAVAIWRSLDTAGHARLVTHYLQAAGFDGVETVVLADGQRGDPLVAVVGRS